MQVDNVKADPRDRRPGPDRARNEHTQAARSRPRGNLLGEHDPRARLITNRTQDA
jgi:hypothetical protein